MRSVIGGLGLAVLLGSCVSDEPNPYRPHPRPTPYTGKPMPAPGFNPFRAKMRRIDQGMSASEVFDAIGPAQRVVHIGSGRQKWRYGHPSRQQLVLTFADLRLRSWDIE